MSDELIPTPDAPSGELARLLDRADQVAEEARAPRTRAEYLKACRSFERWCSARNLSPLPAEPDTVRAYITVLTDSGLSLSTIELRLAAISEAHHIKGLTSPRSDPKVRELIKALRRKLGRAPSRQASALVTASLVRVVDAIEPDGLIALRDRAIILVGWSAALRRSELVALDVSDLERSARGLRIRLGRTKTDQEARGTVVGIPFASDPAHCPVLALDRWLAESRINDGLSFRSVDRWGNIGEALSDRSVARIVQDRCGAVGLVAADYSGHSLRAGLATSAADAGRPDRAIMRQGRWRSPATLERYVRGSTAEREAAFAVEGLL